MSDGPSAVARGSNAPRVRSSPAPVFGRRGLIADPAGGQGTNGIAGDSAAVRLRWRCPVGVRVGDERVIDLVVPIPAGRPDGGIRPCDPQYSSPARPPPRA